jgi:hypothetical protein
MKQLKIARTLMAALILITMLLVPVSAGAIDPIDPEQECELTIEYRYQDMPIGGAEFHLYCVGSISRDGSLNLKAPFDEYPVDFSNITQEKYRILAETLDGFVKLNQLIPDETVTINEYGFGVISGLKPGLYLMTRSQYIGEDGMYSSAAALVALPNRMDGSDDWYYNVQVMPKATFQPHEGMGVTSRKVLKIWDDKGNENSRPESLKVMLLCNGAVYDEMYLSAENGWSYVWMDLWGGNEWTVVEVVPEGYTVEISSDGLVTRITNTNHTPPPPTEPEENTPQTGMLWWPMPLLIIAGVVLIALGIRLRRGDNYEA